MDKPRDICVTVREVSKYFKTVRALDSFSADFQKGVLHGIIGPDGAGKTTLLRLLAGLLRPTDGSIDYSAGGIAVGLDDIREHIGYMPSAASLYPDLSVMEHLEFFKRLYRLERGVYQKKTEELLHMTRLGEFRHRKISQLSGGMYKKAGLICALLRSPAVLLLDEPTNGVDPISRREFWELLYTLAQDNILIILATAYMDEAQRCTLVHLMESGRLLINGAPEDILKNAGVEDFSEIFIREEKSE
ncbi:MAG: ABC transporter ATP-binding protein [Elusimicrobiota bacterium]